MSLSGKKLGLGGLQTKIAHNGLVPSLGNKDLRSLQDIITSEKVLMNSFYSSSRDMERTAESYKIWGSGEGDDLKDVFFKSSTLVNHLSNATSVAASYQSKIREQYKRVRSREEELDDMRRRRKTLSSKIESAEKKLAKMNSENKNLPQQTQLLESFRQQATDLDVQIVQSEAAIWDFKRSTSKTALGYKFCSLIEYAEKVSIIGEMGKLLIEELNIESSVPGQPHGPYLGFEQTERILEQAEKSLSEVTFGPLPLTSRPPELDVSASDFAPRIDSKNFNVDTLGASMNGFTSDLNTGFEDQSYLNSKPWLHQENNSYHSINNGDFRTSNNPNAYSSASAYNNHDLDNAPPPLPSLDLKPQRSFDSGAPETFNTNFKSPSASQLRRARGEELQYDYDTSAFFSRNHAGGFNDAPKLGEIQLSQTPAPEAPHDTKPLPELYENPNRSQLQVVNGTHHLSNDEINQQQYIESQMEGNRGHDAVQGIGLRDTTPVNPPPFEEIARIPLPNEHHNDTHPLPEAPPKTPPKTPPPESKDIYGGIEEVEKTSPLPNPYDSPFNVMAQPPNNNSNPSINNTFTFSPPLSATGPRTVTAGAFKRPGNKGSNVPSPTASDITAPLNINKRDIPMGPPPLRSDSLN